MGERLKRAALPMLLTLSVVSAMLSAAGALVTASPLPLLEVPLAALLGAWAYTGIRPEAGRQRLPLAVAVVLTMVSLACVGVQAGGTARWPGAAVGAVVNGRLRRYYAINGAGLTAVREETVRRRDVVRAVGVRLGVVPA